jgi:tripartite-type tricarboxylate transporter receptor subunit TctC
MRAVPPAAPRVNRAASALSLALLAATLQAPPAPAQEPSAAPALPKQMRIVTGSAGGTGPDFIARLIAPKLGDAAKVSAIVENRPGVNGIVGAQSVARAAPDASVL